MNKRTTRVDHPITQGSDNVAPCLSDHRSRKRWVRLAVSLSLGIALMVVVYRNFDFGELLRELRSNSISWGIIALSILIEALGNVFRGVRWKLLVHPFSKPEPRLRNTILSVLGSYAVNLIFPRAGDVWRCAALSRYESLSMAKLIGSLLMDRLMDMIVLGLIVLMAIGGFSDFLRGYFVEHPDLSLKVSHLVSSPLFYLTLLSVGVFGYLFWRLSKRSRWGAKICKGLRGRAAFHSFYAASGSFYPLYHWHLGVLLRSLLSHLLCFSLYSRLRDQCRATCLCNGLLGGGCTRTIGYRSLAFHGYHDPYGCGR